VRLHAGRIVVDPLGAEPVDAGIERLTGELAARTPRLELTKLLLEVDAWTQFSTHLTHTASATSRITHLAEHLGCR
jgi:hypothetical protein